MHHYHFGRHGDAEERPRAGRRHAHGGRGPDDTWPGGEYGGGHGLRHGHGHGHGGGRGGRLGRLFAHGDLHFVILRLIAERPRHGYELIKAITVLAGGTYTPSPGTIYPALTLLEEQGYVTATASEGSKKLHAITAEGAEYLEVNRKAVDLLLARVAQAGADRPETSPRVVRAVENMKTALRLRLTSGPLSEAQSQALAEILDRAAGEIENI